MNRTLAALGAAWGLIVVTVKLPFYFWDGVATIISDTLKKAAALRTAGKAISKLDALADKREEERLDRIKNPSKYRVE